MNIWSAAKKMVALIAISLTFLTPILASPTVAEARSYRTKSSDVYVHGYTKKNGTYVQPYYRSKADGIISNNYSCIDNGRCGSKSAAGSGATFQNSDTLNSVQQPKKIIQIPENAELNYWRTDWNCKRGYFKSSGLCAQVQVPTNGSLDYWGSDWVCNRGYKKQKSSCSQVQIPPNASLDYWGSDWVCNRGYSKIGNSCQYIQIPANGSLDYWGSDWVCNRGYSKMGSQCQPVQIPLNAHLDYWGTDWECDTGFTRTGSTCVQI